jgi:hypothetical protein
MTNEEENCNSWLDVIVGLHHSGLMVISHQDFVTL